MNKNNLTKVLYTLLLLVFSISITAQTTFGMLEAPADGALLQLKNLESSSNSPVNADKGLLLPRVDLTDINELYPMFPSGYNKTTEGPKHTGLFVFNTNENLFNGDGIGCYLWDGEKWMGMGMVKRKISINPLVINVSEALPKLSAQITTTPLNLPFDVSVSGDVASSSYTLASDKVTFEVDDDIMPAGNKKYTLTLKNSSRSATIAVNHLKLKLAKNEIKVGENTPISTSAIEAAGGTGKWKVKSFTEDVFNWTVKPYNDGYNNLCFELGDSKQTGVETVKGSITVYHENDPNYTKTIEVWQNSGFINLPEFDFLVVEYYYPNTSSYDVDLDTATEINNTKVTGIDSKAVGYGLGSTKSYTDPATNMPFDFLTFAGDNRKGGYEAVYTNMTKLRAVIPSTSPRDLNVDMYAIWWTPASQATDPAKNKIRVRILLYKGGEMKPDGAYNFYNEKDGVRQEPVKTIERTNLLVDTANEGKSKYLDYRNLFSGLLRLEYDRVDETGLVMKFSEITRSQSLRSSSASSDPEYDKFLEANREFEAIPNESKDDLAIRYNKFLEEWNKKHGR